jgi:hypothetical protein
MAAHLDRRPFTTRGLAAYARERVACEQDPRMDYWRHYQCELLARATAAFPQIPFHVDRELDDGFVLTPADGSEDWQLMRSGYTLYFLTRPLDDVTLDRVLGHLLMALEAACQERATTT